MDRCAAGPSRAGVGLELVSGPTLVVDRCVGGHTTNLSLEMLPSRPVARASGGWKQSLGDGEVRSRGTGELWRQRGERA